MIMEQNLIDVFDPASALARVGGDEEFLYEIAGLIRAAWPRLLGDIRADLAAGDFSAAEADASLAKAAALYVSAKKAQDAAQELQSMAAQSDGRGALQASAKLEEEVEKLQILLATLRKSRTYDSGSSSLTPAFDYQ